MMNIKKCNNEIQMSSKKMCLNGTLKLKKLKEEKKHKVINSNQNKNNKNCQKTKKIKKTNCSKREDFKNNQDKQNLIENSFKTSEIINEYDPSSILNIIKNIASDPETNEDKEYNKALDLINRYKNNYHKIVFTEVIFNGSDSNTISPLIFTKKNQPIKPAKPLSQNILAFENYLCFIAQMYYKKNINLLESVSNFEGVCKEAGRPGRKAKNKPLPVNPIVEPSLEENNNNISNSDNKNIQNSNINDLHLLNVNQDILNSLVSPLRKDFIYEKWSPKEIAIFESAICKYGKQFLFIKYLIPTKNFNEIIEFYQAWKQTSHYKIWKYYKNLGNRTNFNHWL